MSDVGGDIMVCTLIYDKLVRAVFPIGEMSETYDEWTIKNWRGVCLNRT
jgi:hypothetical protein